ncbi:MAG: DUF4388 domain-containing protein [Myxococcota bacterium]|nr:DUF4388 domain-containing protein [Myxococcota bacterium]
MASPILIADHDQNRAKRVAEACAGYGFETALVANGAEALEASLADVPEVVVANTELPLIDGLRLAEILRANPRTQDTRFVFVGSAAVSGLSGALGGVLDEALPANTTADDIAARVESTMMARERADAVEREASEGAVQGSLTQIPLTDLLQLFHMNRRSGQLDLVRREPGGVEETGNLALRDGNVLRARAANVEGEKALYRLLSWREGSFSFEPGRVTGSARIQTPTRALLLEGVRQLDEAQRLADRLPPLDARIRLSVAPDELPTGVHPLTETVLRALRDRQRVSELVDAVSWPDYQVLRTIQALVERDLVTLDRSADASGSHDVALFQPAQIRRLRDWLQAGRPRGSRPTEAKLSVIAGDREAARDFADLLSKLPGFELADAFQDDRFRSDDLLPMGRLPVGDGFGLDFLHVPGTPESAPLWPLATHGALGTLLVAHGPAPAEESALRGAAAAAARRPRARIFHVRLLGREERMDPASLQERMGLLDDGSLFLLKLESDRSVADRMRTMLARVMP